MEPITFCLVDAPEPFGLFIDFPGKVVFDIGFSEHDQIIITITGSDVDLYHFTNGTLKELTLAFRRLMGETYVPPKWAFGFQQSRWSYKTRQEIETVAGGFLKHQIPCDAIYLDIDYMERYKDFTIDDRAFPHFPQLVEEMKEQGFRLIPIIDAGVRIEDGYTVYEEGIEKGFFCFNSKEEPFVAAVWPGKVHYPDFQNPEARRWFGLQYKVLTDMGIDGFWNDMNEPSIFYTEDRLKDAIRLAKDSEEQNLDIDTFFHLTDTFKTLFNHPADYQKFNHQVNGELMNHAKIHNLYGFNMTRAAAEGLQEIDPDRRFLLFSRASTVGQGRFAGIWTGDNHSWWEHILLNLQMMPAINQCGILYTGADTGGFSDDANAQLVIRWSQFSLFAPLFRNHAALNTRNQEPYAFDDKTTQTMRNVIRLRYALIPYLYSEYMKAARNNGLYFLPLCFEYKDEQSALTDDQILVGGSLMSAPVYRENARGRYVYLPEPMLLWRAVSVEEGDMEVMSAGHHYMPVELVETPIFIRQNRMLVMGKPAMNVENMDLSILTVLVFIDDQAEYVYYDDDGISRGYQRGAFSEIHLKVVRHGGEYDILVDNRGNEQVKNLRMILVDPEGRREEREIAVRKASISGGIY
jgi:alpha-glucosidase